MKELYQIFQVRVDIISRSKKMRICYIEIEREFDNTYEIIKILFLYKIEFKKRTFYF
jgi:hypothetical protein